MSTSHDTVTIRRIEHTEPLRGLAERDSRDLLAGPALVAEVDGRILAAISLSDRRVLADPFSRTDEVRSLLELRAAQLLRREAKPRRRGERRERARARAALAGSPPGAGGRLLQLP